MTRSPARGRGSVHQLTPPLRPHNSMYVISNRGELVTRYDERLLSATKLSFMYTAGSGPVTFEAGGLRYGCAMGIEVHFTEVFAEYERLDVDNRPESIDIAVTKVASPSPELRITRVFSRVAHGFKACPSFMSSRRSSSSRSASWQGMPTRVPACGRQRHVAGPPPSRLGPATSSPSSCLSCSSCSSWPRFSPRFPTRTSTKC